VGDVIKTRKGPPWQKRCKKKKGEKKKTGFFGDE